MQWEACLSEEGTENVAAAIGIVGLGWEAWQWSGDWGVVELALRRTAALAVVVAEGRRL